VFATVTTQKQIKDNLSRVRERIQRAAARRGRSSESVTLVAVTKGVDVEEIECLHELGVRHIGENRADRAQTKRAAVALPFTWHMIGTVQRRKVPDVVRIFDTVDAVDRLELAAALQAQCEKSGKRLPVLLEVNVSGETSKHGLPVADVGSALDQMQRFNCLEVNGLMTMAPLVERAELTRPIFAALAELAGRHGLKELSMGMSNDFEIAVEEGATQIRIGSALFD
jgi:pyridoxal phosphate enzyme (YggS family)